MSIISKETRAFYLMEAEILTKEFIEYFDVRLDGAKTKDVTVFSLLNGLINEAGFYKMQLEELKKNLEAEKGIADPNRELLKDAEAI
jgi:hypothetical protein